MGPGEGESTSGITIERRTLLWLPVAAIGARVAAGAPQTAGGTGDKVLTPLTREEFGARWQALAAELLPCSERCDESYAGQLAGLLARVPIEALPRLENGRSANGLTAGPSWFIQPCITIEFRMEPGAEIRPHNHPPQIVLTLCAEGEAAYRHLELAEEAPPCTEIDGQEFLVRETRSGILQPGRSTTLTRARDGMHGFVAGPRGARLIDFTLSTTEDIETFSYVKVAPEPESAEERLYRAAWTGKR